jgi:choline dehydrogenase-like flavoprotein
LHNQFFLKIFDEARNHDPAEIHNINKQSLAPIKQFLNSLGIKKFRLSIGDLTVEKRLELFYELIQSEINILRQIGFYLRLYYVNAIFDSPIGAKISGIVDEGYKKAAIMPSLSTFETELHYNHDKEQLQGKIDVLVIGSGPAGSVVAHELQKKNLKVLVVESGPLVIPGAIDTTSNPRFMESQSPRLSENGSIALLNGEVVGGGSSVNLDMSFPPTMDIIRHRFHQWRQEKLISDNLWTDEEIDQAYSWVKSIFEPRVVGFDEINENNKVLMRGAKKLHIPYRRYELNHYLPGLSPHAVYDKKSSFEKLLMPSMLRRHNPVSLLSNCRVTKILIKNGQASGVECLYSPKDFGQGIINDLYGFGIKPNTKITIQAKHIVLAAGTLGSSLILLNSEINNPNIGKGFIAHPFISLMGKFDRDIHANIGEPSTIYIDHYMPTDATPDRDGYLLETGIGRLNLWALLIPGLPHQMRDYFADISCVGGFSVMITDTPNSENRIKIDKDGQPKIHYHLSDKDRDRLIEGVKTSVKILFAAGATEVSFNSFEYPLFQAGGPRSNTITPSMNLEEIFKNFHITPNQTSLLGAHMMAGNKIGVDQKSSVINDKYQVWNTNNLYVVDSSIFPSSVGANPMQTIYTCAKIFADKFIKNLAHKPSKPPF